MLTYADGSVAKRNLAMATSILLCGLYEMFPARRRALRIQMNKPFGLNACGSVGDAFEMSGGGRGTSDSLDLYK